MRRFREGVKGFMALLSFLTIIPTGIHDLSLASRFFYLSPIIGLIEGLVAVSPMLLDAPTYVRAAIILVLSHLITGFNHLDGFADLSDAIASGRRGEDMLRIMKKPERGAAAIASTTLLIIVSYSSLLELVDELWWQMIMLSHVLASESMYLLAISSTPPGYDGLGRVFIVESKRGVGAVVNSISFGLILILIFSFGGALTPHGLTMVAAMTLIVTYTRVKSHRILGFVNGDVLGFCYELTKAATLILPAALTSILT